MWEMRRVSSLEVFVDVVVVVVVIVASEDDGGAESRIGASGTVPGLLELELQS